MTSRQSCWLSRWLSDWPTDWLCESLTGWLSCWLTDWLTQWLSGKWTNWLTDWLTVLLTDLLTCSLTCWLTEKWLNSPHYCLYYLTGLFVAGALNSGRVFIWNKKSATVKTTAVLDKMRNVQPGASKSPWFLDVTCNYCLPASHFSPQFFPNLRENQNNLLRLSTCLVTSQRSNYSCLWFGC